MTQELEIVRISVNPARARDLIRALESARGGYLGPPACIRLDLLINETDDEVAAIVTWASVQLHAQALRSPQAASFFNTVSAFATGAPDVKKYQPVDAGKE